MYVTVLQAPRSPILIKNAAQSGPDLKIIHFVYNLLNSQKLGWEDVAEAEYPKAKFNCKALVDIFVYPTWPILRIMDQELGIHVRQFQFVEPFILCNDTKHVTSVYLLLYPL